ncbi:FAST kinase domain-containing protein 2, mitochondrial [Cololabis saira]|uniref:FAST kinase domain-containing protein 2, mitochondrial n=1 Tax=Cololabis saira TaxID=129043 RepID=UPI002AD3C2CA|nr:FAST kinase domain-containing protein 2, mitochondrial [Cololabis saira]
MSIWVTKKVMRWSLPVCSRRFLWQQHLPLRASITDTPAHSQQLAGISGTGHNQTCLSLSLASAVRYYSNGWNRSDDLEERSFLSTPEVRPDETQLEQRERWSASLQSCGSPSDVLDFACHSSPSHRQVSNCLTRMWSSTKKMSDEQKRYELQLMFDHPEFEKLLQQAMQSADYMRNDDIVYSLLSMVNLGVPQRSRVVQTFLRICQDKVNYLEEKNLSILASCLENMENSSNVVALKDGMRLVVEAQLPSIKNVMALQTMMRLLGKDAPKELKLKLERKALSMTGQFSLPNAQHMIITMATMGFYSKSLLQVCSKKIIDNLHGMPFNRLYKVLQSCGVLLYRDLDLLNEISDHVASMLDIWTNKQVLLFLAVFEDLIFCPVALMEGYAEKVIANPEALTLKDLLCVLKVYSSLNFDLQDRRQRFFESLSHALSSYLSRMSGFELLKASYCLCLVGHFPPALLERLLESSTLEELGASKFLKSRERMFQMVDLCLRLDRPPLPQPLSVPVSVMGNRRPSNPPINPKLSEGLHRALEDQADATLQEMVVVESSYVIDGVISKPLPHQANVTETSSRAGDQCSPVESSQRIAVIYARPSGFCYGTSNLRGPFAVKIRHLKIMGYTPVLVTEQNLQSGSQEERTNILKKLIFCQQEHISEADMKT